MSGLEVLGAVMGGISLVVGGMKYYAEGARTMKRAWGAEREIKSVVRQLDTEGAIFREGVKSLLCECIDVKMAKAMMDDVDGKLWRDPDVEEELKLRLKELYVPYVDNVKNVAENLNKMKKILCLDTEGRRPADSQGVPLSFREVYSRYKDFKFALKRETYQELIQEIKDDNTTLDRLLGRTSATTQTPKSARRIPDFDTVRATATSMFDILNEGLHVSCGASHSASLCLKAPGGSADGFRLVLHHNVGPKQRALPWSVEEAEVRLIDAIAAVSTQTATATTTSAVQISTGRKKKTVQFQDSSIVASAATKDAQVAAQLQEIHDLCQSIDTLRSSQCGMCLGYMKCVSSTQRHGLFWPKQRLLDQASLSVEVESLDDILEHRSICGSTLSNDDTHQLSVALALGILRLHDTPWMESNWNKGSITLISQSGKVMSEHPFISRDLSATPQSATTAAPSPYQQTAAMVIKNQALFNLGVTLIELCMKAPMSELHQPSELNPDHSKHEMSDYFAAVRLVKTGRIQEKLGFRWNEVIRRCIHCDLDQSVSSLEDKTFRNVVYNKIVRELEQMNRQWFGQTVD